jgi:hypothetical protein
MVESCKDNFTSEDTCISTSFNELVSVDIITSGCNFNCISVCVTNFIDQVTVEVVVWGNDCNVNLISPSVDFLVKFYSSTKVRCVNCDIYILTN